jgi:hypothetical protein
MSDPFQPQQPQYPQPEYQQPQYAPPPQQYAPPQQQYGPPPQQYGSPQQYPQYGQPQYAPPPAAAKNRTALIVGLVAVVVLVLFGGAVAVAYNLTRDDEPIATAPTTGKGGGAGGEKRLRLTAVDKVGDWTKAANQERAAKLSAASAVDAIDEPFAAQYDKAGITASVWGGTGATIGYDTMPKVFQAFTKAAVAESPGTPSTVSPVDPGMIGGEAYCMAIAGSSGTSTACFWHAEGVALGFLFTGGEPGDGGPSVKALLAGLLTFS